MEGATGGGGWLGGAAPTSAARASVLSAKGQGGDGIRSHGRRDGVVTGPGLLSPRFVPRSPRHTPGGSSTRVNTGQRDCGKVEMDGLFLNQPFLPFPVKIKVPPLGEEIALKTHTQTGVADGRSVAPAFREPRSRPGTGAAAGRGRRPLPPRSVRGFQPGALEMCYCRKVNQGTRVVIEHWKADSGDLRPLRSRTAIDFQYREVACHTERGVQQLPGSFPLISRVPECLSIKTTNVHS